MRRGIRIRRRKRVRKRWSQEEAKKEKGGGKRREEENEKGEGIANRIVVDKKKELRREGKKERGE